MSEPNFLMDTQQIPFNTLINNRYLIQKILGQGGLGRTYLAWDTHRFNEPCVVKEFAPLNSQEYDLQKSRALFQREAKILHQISHPQIPKFLACFEGQQGRLFLVQEYINGQTYSALLEKRQQQHKTFSELEITNWLHNLLPVLDYIHRSGIIHRDISPDNIMQPQGTSLPILIDFGVGKLTNLLEQETQKHSYVGKMSFVGKIGYAPREQVSMGRCFPSSDLYALGVTALVLLTGKDPTALIDRDSLEWQWQKYIQINPDLTAILSRMTEEKPLKRYQSASEVINDLKLMLHRTEKSAIAKTPLSQPKNDETIILANSTSQTSLEKETTDQTIIVTGVNSLPSASLANNSTIDTSSNHQLTDDTLIISSLNPTTTTATANSATRQLTTEFLQRCERELVNYLGKTANMVIQEVIEQKKPQSQTDLINAVAKYIPHVKQIKEFKSRF